MGIEVHILGTSSARPTSLRQVSGSLISCDSGIAVIDCGEGFQTRFATQRKRMKNYDSYSLKSGKVGVLCLTHGHLDHTWGVLPWLQSMALDNRSQPLLIIGPTSLDVINCLLKDKSLPEHTSHADLSIQFQFWHKLGGTTANLGYPVRWILGDVKSDRWVEFDTDSGSVIELSELPQPFGWKQNQIQALTTNHGIPSCAWEITSNGKKGKFNRTKAVELGLNDDQRVQLAKGQDIVIDDEVLHADTFRDSDNEPLSVVFSGDTLELASGITKLSNCNLLIHEATFLNEWSKHAEEYLHSTAAGAARTALACGAKHLTLTHYGARIKVTDQSIIEAREIISNPSIAITAARDGDRIIVEDNGTAVHLYWRDDGWQR